MKQFVTKQDLADRIKRFTMLDDAFMTAVLADNIPGTELIIRTVLGRPDLTVTEQHVQHHLKNLHGRSSVLDVHAIDSEGTHYDIEVQNDSAGASFRRARYNASLLDASSLPEGTSVDELAECYVIFITREDVIGAGLPAYHIRRMIEETNAEANDGSHLIFINCACEDEGPLATLIHDMKCADPDKMKHEELACRARNLKGNEGMKVMGTFFEDLFYEGKAEGLAEGRAEGLAEGRAEGLAEGRAEGLAIAVATLVNDSEIPIDDALKTIGVPDDLRPNVREALKRISKPTSAR